MLMLCFLNALHVPNKANILQVSKDKREFESSIATTHISSGTFQRPLDSLIVKSSHDLMTPADTMWGL